MTTRPSDLAAADIGFDNARARRQGGLSFDRVAREYDRSRPGYPPELVAHACATAGLQAAALAPGGTLVLLQYCALVDERSQQDQTALLAALARCAPAAAAAWPPRRELDAIRTGVAQRRGNVSEVWSWIGGHELARADAAGLFTDVELMAVPTRQQHSADELNALISTLSFYQQLAPEQREALCAEHVALERALGRRIRSSIVTLLVTARRRG